MPRTRAVLFDFGGTLFDYADVAEAQREGLLALARHAGLPHPPDVLAQAHRRAMQVVFRDYVPKPFYLHRDLFSDALRAMAELLGHRLDDAHVEHFFATQSARRVGSFRLREGVLETLARLRDAGLHLGIVSNIDEHELVELTTLAGLRGRFDSLLSSEAAGSCKPDRRIFEIALERAGCAPGEALFVGDTLGQDVAGANAIGMRSVLLWHRDDRSPPGDGVQPAHVVRTIPEVAPLALDPTAAP
jgi:putative hydrolase of the HAD superfamily